MEPADRDTVLAQVMHDYGETWQIQADRAAGIWTAVERPTPTALHVIAARDLAELVAKLRAATDDR